VTFCKGHVFLLIKGVGWVRERMGAWRPTRGRQGPRKEGAIII